MTGTTKQKYLFRELLRSVAISSITIARELDINNSNLSRWKAGKSFPSVQIMGTTVEAIRHLQSKGVDNLNLMEDELKHGGERALMEAMYD